MRWPVVSGGFALKVSISRWFDTVNFTGEGDVLPGNAPEAAPRRESQGGRQDTKEEKAAVRKWQRPQTVVLPPKKPPISDSAETARPGKPRGIRGPFDAIADSLSRSAAARNFLTLRSATEGTGLHPIWMTRS
jgi:hypothetical protein